MRFCLQRSPHSSTTHDRRCAVIPVLSPTHADWRGARSLPCGCPRPRSGSASLDAASSATRAAMVDGSGQRRTNAIRARSSNQRQSATGLDWSRQRNRRGRPELTRMDSRSRVRSTAPRPHCCVRPPLPPSPAHALLQSLLHLRPPLKPSPLPQSLLSAVMSSEVVQKEQPEEKYQIRPSYKNSSVDNTQKEAARDRRAGPGASTSCGFSRGACCSLVSCWMLLRYLTLLSSRLSAPFSLNPRVVKDLISAVLVSSLQGKEYDQNETGGWTKEIATAIKAKLKELKLPRYKFLVQVIIGEMKGAGVRCGCRCLWDQQTDKVAEATFQNDSQSTRRAHNRVPHLLPACTRLSMRSCSRCLSLERRADNCLALCNCAPHCRVFARSALVQPCSASLSRSVFISTSDEDATASCSHHGRHCSQLPTATHTRHSRITLASLLLRRRPFCIFIVRDSIAPHETACFMDFQRNIRVLKRLASERGVSAVRPACKSRRRRRTHRAQEF